MSDQKPFLIVAANVIATGGMDRANLAVAEYVAKLGVELHIVAYSVQQRLLEYPNVTHHKVNKILNSEFLSEPLIDHTGRKVAKSIAARGGRVMVNGGNCKWPDINWVNHVHSADGAFPPSRPLQKIKRHIDYSVACWNEKRFVPLARTVITSCERTRQDIISHLKVPAEKVIPIYLGMNNDLFRPVTNEERSATRKQFGWPDDQPLAIFVGALGNRRKGFDTLFKAWESLCRESNWDARLLVVGRGAEVPFWQEQINQKGLQEKIQLLGFIDDLPKVVASCDVFVSPSRYEGYSLAAQEAIVSKVPAIVTTKTGFGERYPENLQGLIMQDPDDTESLVNILRDWRSNMQDYRNKVVPFAESLRGYNWNDMAAAMWETILKSSPPESV